MKKIWIKQLEKEGKNIKEELVLPEMRCWERLLKIGSADLGVRTTGVGCLHSVRGNGGPKENPDDEAWGRL